MKKINKKQKNEIPTLNNKQIINSKRKRHNLVKIKKIKKIKKRVLLKGRVTGLVIDVKILIFLLEINAINASY